MRHLSKILVPVILCLSISSFADQNNSTCAANVECQNSKLEAMAENPIFAEFTKELQELRFLLEKLSDKETVSDDYQASGYAKALGRLDDLEKEAASIINTGDVSATSIHGRKLAQIHHEIVEITNSVK